MEKTRFRFETLQIWQRAADISSQLFELADRLDSRKYFRFAEQLRAATLSITNNIAEGSGSDSKSEFAHYVNIARRSVFEVANMLLLFTRKKYLQPAEIDPLLDELVEQSMMLHSFKKTLRT